MTTDIALIANNSASSDPCGQSSVNVIGDGPGVYQIKCIANGATYTGSSIRLRSRLQLHVNLLRTGRNGAALMQQDWDAYGESQFEISSVPTFFRGERADWARNPGLNLMRVA